MFELPVAAFVATSRQPSDSISLIASRTFGTVAFYSCEARTRRLHEDFPYGRYNATEESGARDGEDGLLARITTNHAIFGGKPIIRGHRLAVEHVLGMLAAGDTSETVARSDSY